MKKSKLNQMLRAHSLRKKYKAELDAALEKAMVKVEVSEEQFRRCREKTHGCRQKVGEDWFDELELPLLPREAGCLDFLCA